MLYGVWITGNDKKGKLERVVAQSRTELDEELGNMELVKWFVQFEAATETDYKRNEAVWRKRVSTDSYSGSDPLP